jgi:hypothetical protein
MFVFKLYIKIPLLLLLYRISNLYNTKKEKKIFKNTKIFLKIVYDYLIDSLKMILNSICIELKLIKIYVLYKCLDSAVGSASVS